MEQSSLSVRILTSRPEPRLDVVQGDKQISTTKVTLVREMFTAPLQHRPE